MKLFPVIFLALAMMLCVAADSNPYSSSRYNYANYILLKNTIKHNRSVYNEYYDNIAKEADKEQLINGFGMMLETYIIDSLPPYWLGTKWSFEGKTSVPRKGSIACGYFVGTVLRDIGFNIDRIKAGQLAAIELIYGLLDRKHIWTTKNASFEALVKHVKAKGEGVYIIGLDTHVGFLLHRNGKLVFYHSTEINPCGVKFEYAAESKSINNSKCMVVGSLTKDKSLITKWLDNTRIRL